MKTFLTFALLAFITSVASADPIDDMMKQAQQLFKQAENSIIDQLRANDPTLDSRLVKFTYGDYPGVVFADCCFVRKELIATNSNDQKDLGSYLVEIGNSNYIDFGKGIMNVSIMPEGIATASPSSSCDYNLSTMVVKLFGPGSTTSGDNPPYAESYFYQVTKNNKNVGTITLSPLKCELVNFSVSVQISNGG